MSPALSEHKLDPAWSAKTKGIEVQNADSRFGTRDALHLINRCFFLLPVCDKRVLNHGNHSPSAETCSMGLMT